MKPTLKAGIVLGVLVVVWIFINGVTGWYKDPAMMGIFYFVIVIEVGVLFWGLRMTAKDAKGYGAQLGAGTLMSVYGAIIIFFGSLLFTLVVFPHYSEDMRMVTEQALRAKGMAEDQIKTQVEMAATMQTPFMNALLGAIMTILTGFVASLILAAFLKKKPEASQQPPAA